MIGYLFSGIAIIGTIANVKKKPYAFVLWLISNSFFCITAAMREDWPQTIMFGFYMLLCIWGIREWYGKK